MKTRKSKPVDAAGVENRGAALVIILAFIVLMTGLVVAFFSRAITERQVSNSSANQTKADILARSALALVTGDLKQEIAYGSASPSPASNGIYIPVSNIYMKPVKDPALTGSNTMPNLIRTSGTSQIQINGHTVDGEASAVSATGTSANGRSIGLDRWNSHYLIPLSGTTVGDSTPISDFSNVAPSWVMVTTQGPQVLTSPTNTVTGRYAYAIYDESLLLDMNVAGYPASSGTTNIGGKSSLAYADLTQILTQSGITNPAVSRQVDNILGWRNYATLRPSGQSLGSFDFSGTSMAVTGTNYDKYVLSATNGFLTTSGTTYSNRTDQMFTSRQALIKFVRAMNINQDALKYIGTFSRAVNSPSWFPENDASTLGGSNGTGNIYAYKANAETASISGTANPNRDIPAIRFDITGTSRYTVTHYNDDGTPAPYTVQAGDALVQRRFSLAKLAWLGHNGLNTAAYPAVTDQAVLDCFGLTWNDAKKRWDYNHGDPSHILTLDAIAQKNREPDFFELLKAGILQGSLGGDPGITCDGPLDGTGVAAKFNGPLGVGFEVYSKNKDIHIRQIGANIIDQADADNYPTAIYQDNVQRSGDGAMQELYNTVFGNENLPMLTRVGVAMCYMPDHTVNPVASPATEGVWLKPELWNPNESSTANPAKCPLTPSVLRLVTYGSCYYTLNQNDGGKPAKRVTADSTPVDFGEDPNVHNIRGTIQFKNPSPVPTNPATPAAFPFFQNPVSLEGWWPSDSGFVEPNYYSGSTSDSYSLNRYPPGKTASWDAALHHDPFLALWLGELDRDPATYKYHDVQLHPDPWLTFVVEYYDGSRWAPYSLISRLSDMEDAGAGSTQYGRPGWWVFGGHADPRTDRFSASCSTTRAGNNDDWSGASTLLPDPKWPSTSAGTGWQSGSPPDQGRGNIYWAWPRTEAGFTNNPVSTNSGMGYQFDAWAQNQIMNAPISDFRYMDPDGVTRPGDGWRREPLGAANTGDGSMLAHQNYLTASAIRRRPVILNRPFRSAAELGYVFRDQPFKSLDFWSSLSADSALLDLFSATDQPVVTAGQISPSATAPVLQAIINGAMKQENPALVTSGTDEASAVGPAIVAEISSSGPLINPGDLPVRLSDSIYTALKAFTPASPQTIPSTNVDPKANINKTYGESTIRALAPVTNTRTWNLMIDVVAQSGHMGPGAKSLNSFVVEGEKRYWLHIAIDRFSGRVVDQQLEPVYE